MTKEPKCYAQKDALPHVEQVIGQLCQRSGEAKHVAIVDELMKHPEASSLIEEAFVRCPRMGRFRIASNMVQFLSKNYTDEIKSADEFQARFDRRKDEPGNWAYSLR